MTTLADRYIQNLDNLLELVSQLDDRALATTPNATTPSIAFNIWHLARWADYLQELFNGRGSQIWERERLAERWQLGADLGYAQTGMELDAATAMTLRLPTKAVLLDYARRAFAAAHAGIRTLRDDEFLATRQTFHGENWHDGQIGPIIVTWMTHDNRHLGMIECLVGLLGRRGSADA